MREETLVIIKPDAVESGWTKQIIERYQLAGFKIVARQDFQLSKREVAEFYREHQGKFFFVSLKLAMSSGPSVILVLSGEDAIAQVRKLNGATDPAKAEPGTIRHDFRSGGGPFNTVHSSDSAEAAERESTLFFRQ